MDFNFTSEQDQLRDTVARLVRQQYDFDTRRKVAKSEAGWRPEMWSQFAELGLLGASFSEEDGGFGGGAIEAMIISEEFGKGLVIEPYLQTVIIGGNFLRHGGTGAQKEEHIAGLVGGETIFAFAYSEPKSRFDLNDVSTTAKKDGAGFVLNGHKAVVIGAPFATHLIVTARTSGGQRDTSGITVFVVPKSAKGITTRDYPTVDGLRASEVYFENVSVGADAVIGAVDGGLPLIERRSTTPSHRSAPKPSAASRSSTKRPSAMRNSASSSASPSPTSRSCSTAWSICSWRPSRPRP